MQRSCSTRELRYDNAERDDCLESGGNDLWIDLFCLRQCQADFTPDAVVELIRHVGRMETRILCIFVMVRRPTEAHCHTEGEGTSAVSGTLPRPHLYYTHRCPCWLIRWFSICCPLCLCRSGHGVIYFLADRARKHNAQWMAVSFVVVRFFARSFRLLVGWLG